MQVLPGNPVILWSGTSEARTRKIPSMRSETAPPTGSAVFIGGAPMKGRAEALPLAYLEQSAEMRKTGSFANEL